MNGNVEYCVRTCKWGNSRETWYRYDEYESSVFDEYEELYKKQYVVEKILAKRVRVEYLVLYKDQSYKARYGGIADCDTSDENMDVDKDDYTEADRIEDFLDEGALWEPVEFLNNKELIEEFEKKEKARVSSLKGKGKKVGDSNNMQKEKKSNLKRPKNPSAHNSEDPNGNEPKKSAAGKNTKGKTKGEEAVTVNVGDNKVTVNVGDSKITVNVGDQAKETKEKEKGENDKAMKDPAPGEKTKGKEKKTAMTDSKTGTKRKPEDNAAGGVAKIPKKGGVVTEAKTITETMTKPKIPKKGGAVTGAKTITETVTKTVTTRKVEDGTAAGPSGDKKPRACGLCREPGHVRTKCPKGGE